ncbi:hypothetical protein ACQPZA_12630 [Pseudonocardia xinjiangensis]|uniref:hypothetical protein n=1 Tax=Pseudonocardia xinjiangensis TaxID=75289 RepID=UPI003D9042E7
MPAGDRLGSRTGDDDVGRWPWSPHWSQPPCHCAYPRLPAPPEVPLREGFAVAADRLVAI